MSKVDALYKILESEQTPSTVDRMWQKIYAQRVSDGDYRPHAVSSSITGHRANDDGRRVVSIRGQKRDDSTFERRKKKSEPSRFRRWVWPLAAALIVATMVGVFLTTAPTRQTLKLVNNRSIPDSIFTSKQRRFEFVDGSSIVSQRDTHFNVVSNQSDAIEFSLKKGKMSFEVTPNRHRKWTVYCGDISVNVVGTKFKVRRINGKVAVDVTRGTVVVRGRGISGGMQKLTAGMNLEVAEKADRKRFLKGTAKMPEKPVSEKVSSDNGISDSVFTAPWMSWERTILPADSSVSATAKQNSAASSVYEEHPMAEEPIEERGGGEVNRQFAVDMADDDVRNNGEVRIRGKRKVQSSVSWKKLAESGNFEDAYKLVPPGTFSNLHAAALSEAELFALSDIARATGHMQQSCAALDTLIEKYPHSSRAGLAAYTLARIHIDSLKNPVNGRRYLEQAIEYGLSRTLRETAIYRLVILYREKNPAKALGYASAYLTDYPNGRYFGQITETMNSLKE